MVCPPSFSLSLTFSSRLRRRRLQFNPQQCIRDVRVRRNIDHLSRMGDSSQRNRRRRRPTATAATDAKEREKRQGGEEEEVKPTRRRSVRPSPRQRARAGDFGLNERRSERRRAVHQRHQAGQVGWVGWGNFVAHHAFPLQSHQGSPRKRRGRRETETHAVRVEERVQ